MDEQLATPHSRRSVEEMLKQVPVPPMPDDGVRPFAIGTLLFVIGAIVLHFAGDAWIIQDWWRTAAFYGIGIGVFGTAYCLWRRSKRLKDAD